MLGAHGYCQWGRSASRQLWPVAWRCYISPWMCGDSLVVGGVLSAPILKSTVRSSDYCGWTVVVARHHCPALGGRRRAVTIAGVDCVARRVRRCCPGL